MFLFIILPKRALFTRRFIRSHLQALQTFLCGPLHSFKKNSTRSLPAFVSSSESHIRFFYLAITDGVIGAFSLTERIAWDRNNK